MERRDAGLSLVAVAAASEHELTREQLPALSRATARQSRQAQNRYFLATAAQLGFATAAAVFGAITLRSGGTDWGAALAAGAFVGAIGVSLWLLETRPERRWYEGRAAAESVKTLAWQYAVGGGDFRVGAGDERETDERFLRLLREIVASLKGLAPIPVGTDAQITERMRALRRTPLEIRRDVYRRNRILDQLAWYSDKASFNDRLRFGWSGVSILLQVAGFAGALFKVVVEFDVDLLGIFAAAAVAAAAWMRGKAYAELSQAYAVTAQDLAAVRDTMDVAPRETEEEWAEFVRDAETALSREHTLWRARRTDERTRPA